MRSIALAYKPEARNDSWRFVAWTSLSLMWIIVFRMGDINSVILNFAWLILTVLFSVKHFNSIQRKMNDPSKIWV